MKRVLTGIVQEDPPIEVPWLDHTEYRLETRSKGIDWPSRAHSMIGLRRLDNVQHCIEEVLQSGIPGDLAEAGVWRGGTTIFMRAVLQAYGVIDRAVWVADSFQGLPASAGWPQQQALAVTEEQVRHNFGLYGLLDTQVKFLPGWFDNSLPDAPIKQLAVLRLDGDLYESQLAVLTHLYPKLSPGGFVIIDDPQLAGCQQAIQEYRHSQKISEAIRSVDGYAVYWQKAKQP